MRKSLMGASLALLAACAPLPELRPVLMHDEVSALEPDGDEYAAGKRHLAAGQLGLAVERFRMAVAKDRSSLAALNALAACYDRLGRFDLADRYYDQALALDPDDPQTLNNAGISSLMRGRAARAVALLSQAEEGAPEDPVVVANLARATKAQAQELAAAPSAEEDEARPNRIQRVGLNSWHLSTGAPLQPAVWFRPMARPSDEPPLPLAAPRPEVTRVALEAPPAPPQAKPAPGRVQTHVVNGVGRRGMAARMRAFLQSHGLLAEASIADAPAFNVAETILTYHPSRRQEAETIARTLPAGIRLRPDPAQRHPLVLVLGRDLIPFDQTQQR